MNPEKNRERKPDTERAVEQGVKFLESEQQNGYFPSYIGDSRDLSNAEESPREVFSTVVIVEAVKNTKLSGETKEVSLNYLEEQRRSGQFTFFEDRNLYPPDADTDALGHSLLLESGKISREDADTVLDKIVDYKDENGLVQVWLSKERENRLDPVVGVNALYFAHLLERGSELTETEDWVLDTLDSGDYKDGSRYYQSPDSFLYFMGRLMKFPELAKKIKPKLTKQLRQRIGKTEYPLDLAMRVSLAKLLGMENRKEKELLLQLQQSDGSWPADALFKLGSEERYFGSSALVTALSIKALST